MAKINMICGGCGSNDVGRDATARWCIDKQEWVLSGVFDNAFCEECQVDDPDLEEVEIEE